MNKAPQKSAFTLVELLVVISIIAILAGLGLTGGNIAMRAAKRAQATMLMSQIKTSIALYQSEYGRLPLPEGTKSDIMIEDAETWKNLIICLGGNRDPVTGAEDEGDGRFKNTREVKFLEAKPQTIDENGVIFDPTFPSKSQEYFVLLMDGDYSGSITVEPDPRTLNLVETRDLNTTCALYSRNGGTEENPEKALTNW